MNTIDRFNGEFRFLSNFWPAEVEFDGEIYRTVEHAYQAAKVPPGAVRDAVRFCETPGEAKRMMLRYTASTGFHRAKVAIMLDLVRQKFTRDQVLRGQLLNTGDAVIVEGNDWGDEFWGKVPDANGRGLNMLGAILMIVRSEISAGLPSSRNPR